MNILMLIDDLEIGGAQTHVVTLARALRARGHSVTVWTQGGALEGELIADGCRIVHSLHPLTGRRFWFEALTHVRNLRQLQKRERFDILHAHTRRSAWLVRLLGRMSVTTHDPLSEGLYRKEAIRRTSRPARIVTCHALFRLRGRALSYWGEKTIAVSEDLREHLKERFGVEPARITVIPNGIDPARFHPSYAPLPSQACHVVFASRLDADCSAAAFSLIDRYPHWQRMAATVGRSLTVTLVGGGDCSAQLQAASARLRATLPDADIRLIGRKESLADLLPTAHVFVGVSRAALEALFCGCEVILAGNEGFGGRLTEENFKSFAAGNFCCRGQGDITSEGMDAAFFACLSRLDAPRPTFDLSRFDAATMAKATETVYRAVLQKARRLHVLLAGYAGCGNLGDDAIVRRLIARYHDAPAPQTVAQIVGAQAVPPPDPETEPPRLLFSVTTGGSLRLDAQSPPVQQFPRLGLFALVRAMRGADAVWLGGGCLLQNCSTHGTRSLLYYLGLLALARLCGCPAYLYANGIGPLQGRAARRVAARVLQGVRGISVRDAPSAALLLQMGLHAPVYSVDDPVSTLTGSYPSRIQANDSNAPPTLAVIPRGAGNTAENRALLHALLHLCADGVRILFFPFDTRQDTALCRWLSGALPVGAASVVPVVDEQEVLSALSGCDAVLSSRLHGLILSRCAAVPAVALPTAPSDPKLSDFARSHGLFFLPHEATAQTIEQAIRSKLLLFRKKILPPP